MADFRAQWSSSRAAARYELRWSTQPITEASFGDATAVPAPTPDMAGAAQEATKKVESLLDGGSLELAAKEDPNAA